MSTTEVVRATWLKLDKGWCQGWRCSSHKNLLTFYTTWRAAEELEWCHKLVSQLQHWTEKLLPSSKQWLLQVLYRCHRSLDTRSNFSYPGQNEIWQVLPLSGRKSVTPRSLEVLLLEVLYLDRFQVEEFNDFLSGRWMAALQVAQHHFLSAHFSEAW